MQEKLFEIHGFLTQKGGSLGQTKDFKYFEVLIPELQFPSSSVAAVSLDILVTILIARDSTPANVGKQATRKIKAVVVRTSDKIITVTKSVEGIHVDTEMELAQTNLLVSNNKLFLAVTGTANGTLFSCSASVRYVATGEKETPKHRSVLEKIETGTIIEYPNSSIDVDHNDLDGRSADDCHPGDAVSYENVDGSSNPQGDLFATDMQTAVEEIQDLANHGPQTGSITRVGGEVTEVEYVREFGTMTIVLTRDGDGNVVKIESTYDNGVDTPIVRTKTLTYDVDGNLTAWSTV